MRGGSLEVFRSELLAIYTGASLNATRGGLIAGSLFVLSGVLALGILSAIYVRLGEAGPALRHRDLVQAGRRTARRAINHAALLARGRRLRRADRVQGALPNVVLTAGLLGWALTRRIPEPATPKGHGDANEGPTSLISDATLNHERPRGRRYREMSPLERGFVTADSDSSVSANRTVRERSTRQFQAVQDELATGEDFRSAQDIHAALRARGATVGLATVYRALQSLVDSEAADVLRTAAGEAVYRECGATHHHHLMCRSCGKAVEVQGPAVERWADEMANQHGFTDLSHTLELFGTCTTCQDRLQ